MSDIKKLKELANNLLNPSVYGHCVNASIRDDAREALGLSRVELAILEEEEREESFNNSQFGVGA